MTQRRFALNLFVYFVFIYISTGRHSEFNAMSFIRLLYVNNIGVESFPTPSRLWTYGIHLYFDAYARHCWSFRCLMVRKFCAQIVRSAEQLHNSSCLFETKWLDNINTNSLRLIPNSSRRSLCFFFFFIAIARLRRCPYFGLSISLRAGATLRLIYSTVLIHIYITIVDSNALYIWISVALSLVYLRRTPIRV